MRYFILFLFLPILVFAEPSSINKEKLAELSQDPYWLALVHYQKTVFGYKSYIDTKDFFLADNGKYDPYAELQQTLLEVENSSKKDSEHPICKYPARFKFLDSKLNLSSKLKLPNCSKFDEWIEAINPKGITLIFPTSFLNSPASAFGHTFIRFDTAHEGETDLLSYSASFSAATGNENAILYAILGLFGGYHGFFNVSPYYKMVKQYSDLEKRDIWEYELNFSPEEAKQVVRHLWELRNVSFDYYYLDENCALHLLGLFEVVRPNLKLREKFNIWVLPIDTIKVILRETSLVRKKTYRPSLTTKLEEKINSRTKQEVFLAKNLVKTKNTDLVEMKQVQKANVLDLAYDYLEYLMVSNKVDHEKSKSLGLEILRKRSEIPLVSESLKIAEPATPESIHDSARFAISTGMFDDDSYVDLLYRTAYHDLTDSSYGTLQGAGIEFLDFAFRKRESDNFKLQRLELLNLISLSPKNEMIRPLSWKFTTGAERIDQPGREQKLAYKTSLYLGATESFSEKNIAYILLGPAFNFASRYDDNYSAGLGFNIGSNYQLTNSSVANVDFKTNRHFFGGIHSEVSLDLGYTINLNRNVAFKLNFARKKDFRRYLKDYNFAVNFYF